MAADSIENYYLGVVYYIHMSVIDVGFRYKGPHFRREEVSHFPRLYSPLVNQTFVVFS